MENSEQPAQGIPVEVLCNCPITEALHSLLDKQENWKEK